MKARTTKDQMANDEEKKAIEAIAGFLSAAGIRPSVAFIAMGNLIGSYILHATKGNKDAAREGVDALAADLMRAIELDGGKE